MWFFKWSPEKIESTYRLGRDAYKARRYSAARDYLTEAGQRGHKEAQYLMGQIEETARNVPEALRWYEQAAEQGNCDAMLELAELCLGRHGKGPNPRLGLQWLEKAADWGNYEAQMKCAEYHDNGWGGPKDPGRALYWYERAVGYERRRFSSEGTADLQCGLHYFKGQGTQQDVGKALEYFLKAAEHEYADPRSFLYCGKCYAAMQKPDEALEWLVRAMSKQVKEAWAAADRVMGQTAVSTYQQFLYAEQYKKGLGVEKNDVKALYWYLKAAERGDAAAQYNCGAMCYSGRGTVTDYKSAFAWCKKAAEQGNAFAQYNCGVMYYKGKGVGTDKKSALKWYLKAAEQGYAPAQNHCGYMYSHGEGTEADPYQAFTWYEKAAEQGLADAQYACGCMYSEEGFLRKDPEKARYWLEKAAAGDNAKIAEKARRKLKKL